MHKLQRIPCVSAGVLLLTLTLAGCPTTLGPLARHANAFASATVTVVHGAANAYTRANTLHDEAQIALAVLNYDKAPNWNPNDYVKPLLNAEQLEARIHILHGLKYYAETVADLAAGPKSKDLNDAAKDAGANLQDLSKNIPTALTSSIPGGGAMSEDEKNGVSTALVALGRFLQERKIATSLPKVIEDNDKNVAVLCSYLDSDIRILRRQADIDYGRVITAEDEYIRHTGTGLTPVERRAEIEKLPRFVLEQKENDELLAKLQKTIHTLAETHHAFAAAAQGGNPESITDYINDLAAEGQSLAAYYDSLSAKPKAASTSDQ